ncbi:MAG: YkgJ family cysteine cluster protein [Novosphingobium sp.]
MTATGSADPPELEQDLCTGCAACCDGTLFTYVPVKAEEVQSVERLFTLEPSDDGAIFQQPCPHSVGQVCQVYAFRPRTCRNFRCKTLDAMRNGDIDSTEAARRIQEMLTAREQLKSLLLENETLASARDRRQVIAKNPARTAGETAFLLKLTAFDLLLDRYFRDPGQQMFSRSASGTQSV